MLKLSKKVEYALIVLLDLDERNKMDSVTTKSLALQYHIPQEILGKVLQSLSREGLLQSVQGVKGGYIQTQTLDQINVRQVIEAVDGPISITSCIAENDDSCDQQTNCTIRTPMTLIQNELNDFFTNISLKVFKQKYYRYNFNQIYQVNT